MNQNKIYNSNIQVKDINLNYTYQLKDTRSLRLTFLNKNIHLYVSKYFTIKDINNFIEKNINQIYKSYLIYQKYFFSIDNKRLYIFDKLYDIEFLNIPNFEYKIDEFENKVYIKDFKSLSSKIKIIYKIYEQVLTDYINVLINEKYLNYIKDYKIQLVYSKTFLGRCIYKTKTIQINYLLAKYDKKILNSTLVHEIAHIYEKNHQTSFYKKMKEIDTNAIIKEKNIVLVKKEEI